MKSHPTQGSTSWLQRSQNGKDGRVLLKKISGSCLCLAGLAEKTKRFVTVLRLAENDGKKFDGCLYLLKIPKKASTGLCLAEKRTNVEGPRVLLKNEHNVKGPSC